MAFTLIGRLGVFIFAFSKYFLVIFIFSIWQMVFTLIGRKGALILAFFVYFLVIYNLLGAHQIKLFFNPTHPITKFSRLWVCNQRELQGPKVACCYCFWVWGKKNSHFNDQPKWVDSLYGNVYFLTKERFN